MSDEHPQPAPQSGTPGAVQINRAAAWYLFGYLFVGTVLFAITLTAAITGAVLSITLAGIPVLVAAFATIGGARTSSGPRCAPWTRHPSSAATGR
jgi:hypothetical protein